jgi:hypothetical protein
MKLYLALAIIGLLVFGDVLCVLYFTTAPPLNTYTSTSDVCADVTELSARAVSPRDYL